MTPQQPTARCVLSILALLGCASCAPDGVGHASALDWHPRLDPVIGQLEEALAAAEQQQPRNYMSSNLAFALDAKLYLLFEQYMAAVRDETRPAVLNEQRRWLEKRKRATSEAYAEYEGGTLASFVGNLAFIEVTKERIAELEQRLRSAVTATVP